MRNIYITSLIILIASLTSAICPAQSVQGNYCDSLWNVGNYSTENVLAKTYHNPHPALQAQYYLNWASGSIYYTDGRIIKNQKLRYHSYSDNIHWQRQSDKLVGEIPKSSIEKVVIHQENNQNIVFQKVELKLPFSFNSSEVLLQVLNQGKIELCCYRKAKYIKNSEDGFYSDHQYYLKKENNYNIINLSKSALLSQFTKEEDLQIKSLIKENKLKVKHEADMIKAIDLINEIIK